MELEALVQYADDLLGIPGHPDYPTAINGLQVAGPEGHRVRTIAAAVDASEAVIADAIERGADLLVVHHGLFWGGLRAITGRRYRKLRRLVTEFLPVYSVHLPLDAHRELGNSALLARALDVEIEAPFGRYEDVAIGWRGRLPEAVAPKDLADRVSEACGAPARVFGGGPERVEAVGIVTGGGAGFLEEASRAGLDALVTGEGAHHTFTDAHELGVHLVLGGHYATETFGVKALSAHLAERFGLDWEFLDHPSGL